MSQGRCECGMTGSVCQVHRHQVSCPEYALAFREGRATDPGQAYQAWVSEGKPAARAAAHVKSVADTDARREVMAARFAGKDILED